MEFNRKVWNLTPHCPRNPRTDGRQIWHGWWGWRPIPCARFITIRRGDCRACCNAYKVTRLLSLLGLPLLQNQDPCTYFYVQYVKWRRFAQASAFWAYQKQNFTFRPHFPPKWTFYANFRRDWENSREKRLNNGEAHLYTTINRHRSPWKLYGE